MTCNRFIWTDLSTFDMAKDSIVDVPDPSGVVHSQVIESPEGEVRLNLNGQTDTGELVGRYVPAEAGGWRFAEGLVPRAMRNGFGACTTATASNRSALPDS